MASEDGPPPQPPGLPKDALVAGVLAIVAIMVAASVERFVVQSHDGLAAHPQPFSYEELTAPLEGAVRSSVGVGGGDGGRTLSVLASPDGPSGKTVVLLHGFKMHAGTWALVWNELRRRGHRVIAPDLPGHGSSGLADGALELESLAGDLRTVLGHFRVVNGALVAHSLGGLIAVKYLSDHPVQATERLNLGFACIACTAGDWPRFMGSAGGNWHGNMLMRSGIFDLLMSSEWFAPMLMAKKFGKPSLPAVRLVVNASRVGASRAALKPLSDLPWNHDLHAALRSLPVPSVLAVGALDDHHAHPTMSDALQSDMAASGKLRAYIEIPDAGHFLPLMKPMEVADAVERLWSP